MTKTAQQKLRDGYAASTPIRKQPLKAGDWPDAGRAEETAEMERVRAGLGPAHRMSVGYARIQRGER
jgi:hypothetical protein